MENLKSIDGFKVVQGEIQSYTKSVEDEIDFKLLDQFYGVASQISNFCFETKKFCVTTQFVVLALMLKFTSDKLDTSLFVTGLIIPICFLFLDSVAYYYQVSLRGRMDETRKLILARNQRLMVDLKGVSIIEPNRLNKSKKRRIFDAVVNHSMWLYGFLIFIDLIVWFLYTSGFIK